VVFPRDNGIATFGGEHQAGKKEAQRAPDHEEAETEENRGQELPPILMLGASGCIRPSAIGNTTASSRATPHQRCSQIGCPHLLDHQEAIAGTQWWP
jgi:hypothetical protein